MWVLQSVKQSVLRSAMPWVSQ
jgi:hypothetical protein